MGGAARRHVGAAIASVVLVLGATACLPLSALAASRIRVPVALRSLARH